MDSANTGQLLIRALLGIGALSAVALVMTRSSTMPSQPASVQLVESQLRSELRRNLTRVILADNGVLEVRVSAAALLGASNRPVPPTTAVRASAAALARRALDLYLPREFAGPGRLDTLRIRLLKERRLGPITYRRDDEVFVFTPAELGRSLPSRQGPATA